MAGVVDKSGQERSCESALLVSGLSVLARVLSAQRSIDNPSLVVRNTGTE